MAAGANRKQMRPGTFCIDRIHHIYFKSEIGFHFCGRIYRHFTDWHLHI
jgi:hypothetical protein